MGLFDFFKRKKKEPTQSFVERRLIPRWLLKTGVKLKCGDSDTYVDCRIEDLNFKGLAVSLAGRFPQDCTRLCLKFSESFVFKVEIAVVWHLEEEGRNIYGVKFTRLRDPDKERLYQMMRENFPGRL
jgi:hypothetical protein